MTDSLHPKLQAAVSARPATMNLLNPWITKADLFSNDYLSLSCDSRLRSLVLERLSKERDILGSRGSRLLDGNTTMHVALESRLQEYYDAPAAILFNSGYDANVSLFGTLPQRGDVIVYDELIHASALDGMRVSRAAQSLYPFRHDSVASLKAVLQDVLATKPGVAAGSTTVIVTFETVYSMDGHMAPVKALVETVENTLPTGCAKIVVDEAHSTGLYGSSGRGLVSHLGLEDRVAIRLHTFGKAMASTGAVLLCSPLIRTYLINFSRPLWFTTAQSRLSVIATQASLDLVQGDVGDDLRQRLFTLTRFARNLVESKLSKIPSCRVMLPQDAAGTASPIIPILTPHAIWLAAELRRKGWAVVPIITPAVPKGEERIRMIVHAQNTEQEIEEFVQAIYDFLWNEDRERNVSASIVIDATPVARL